MLERRPTFTWLVVCLGTIAGCDIVIDKIKEGAAPAPPNSGGGGPGGQSGGGAPLPPAKPCASTSQCSAGETCSTEWGVCQAPPGCVTGNPCPAVCYGTCETGKPACQSDADCRLVSNYCEGCQCLALGK